MSRARVVHRCRSCGSQSPRWSGRCPGCAEWNTLVQESVLPARALGRRSPAGGDALPAVPVPLVDLDSLAGSPRATTIAELDRVLGGGLVPGSVTLLGGEPGIGKSTLLLQALAALAGGGARGLLVSAEESPQQVKRRADRLGIDGSRLWVVGETGLAAIGAAVDELEPEVLVVDSIQTVWDPGLDAGPGSVAQVRGCAQALAAMARSRRLTTVLVGHVTKDGTLAGPRVLEHLVDTVLTFEGERHHALRLLRATKHRFGPTGELGVFEMTGRGMAGVVDASGMFLADRQPGTAGSAVFPAVEGRRPVLVEVQALVVRSDLANPRRSVSGLDSARLCLLIAILDKRAGISLQGCDVYASAAGGARVGEPGADLALCLAVASASLGVAVPDDLVVIGEVGLAGEIRRVTQTPRRLAEAARLGFGRALLPASSAVTAGTGPLRVLTASGIAEAVGVALCQPVSRPGAVGATRSAVSH
ncbi:MAG: DNA repair protein RadA [Acidimicrobiales bacterium]